MPKANRQLIESMFLNDMADELDRAILLWPSMNSHHEAYATILEELEEYWFEVKKKAHKRDPAKMRTELLQTATMCLRAVVDLELPRDAKSD